MLWHLTNSSSPSGFIDRSNPYGVFRLRWLHAENLELFIRKLELPQRRQILLTDDIERPFGIAEVSERPALVRVAFSGEMVGLLGQLKLSLKKRKGITGAHKLGIGAADLPRHLLFHAFQTSASLGFTGAGLGYFCLFPETVKEGDNDSHTNGVILPLDEARLIDESVAADDDNAWGVSPAGG